VGKSEVDQVPAKVGEKAAEGRADQSTRRSDCGTLPLRVVIGSLTNRQGNFILIWPVSFVKPWLPLSRKPCASFSAEAKSFFCVAQIALLS
jgi:hypothetical protein